MTTTVVNIKNTPGFGFSPHDIDITRRGPFGNEFVIGVHGNRDQVCDLYKKKHEKDPAFMMLIRDTARKHAGHAIRLGCVCKPKRCHGDWIARLFNGR